MLQLKSEQKAIFCRNKLNTWCLNFAAIGDIRCANNTLSYNTVDRARASESRRLFHLKVNTSLCVYAMLKDYADHIYIHTLQRILTQIHTRPVVRVYGLLCTLLCMKPHTASTQPSVLGVFECVCFDQRKREKSSTDSLAVLMSVQYNCYR